MATPIKEIDIYQGSYRPQQDQNSEVLDLSTKEIQATQALNKQWSNDVQYKGQKAEILQKGLIWAAVSVVLAAIAIYVLYAGQNQKLWDLTDYKLHCIASIIGAVGVGGALISIITSLCCRALLKTEVKIYDPEKEITVYDDDGLSGRNSS